MSLIKCPECGKEISEYADKCIGCGCPMEVIKKLLCHGDNTRSKPTVEPKDKYLSTIDKDAYNFICDFTIKLEGKYPGGFYTKENYKSFVFKFYKYEKLLLRFKTIESNGALKLEYKTSSNKRWLMPVAGGYYNLDRLLSKLLPKLDEFFNNAASSIAGEKISQDNSEKANAIKAYVIYDKTASMYFSGFHTTKNYETYREQFGKNLGSFTTSEVPDFVLNIEKAERFFSIEGAETIIRRIQAVCGPLEIVEHYFDDD